MQERNLRRGPRRRSERLPAQILVQLAGATETGQEFMENSHTLTLSQCGASILSKRKSDTPRKAGGLVSRAASKAVV